MVSGLCVQDMEGDYEANQDCTFTFTGSAELTRDEWGFESVGDCAYDYLQLNGGTKYCGGAAGSTAFPATLVVSGTTSFSFHSDSDTHGTGFRICAPDPTSSPTKAPTPSGHTHAPTPAPTATPTPAPVQVSSWVELRSAIDLYSYESNIGAAVGPLSIDLAATFNSNYDSEIAISESFSGSNKIITINGNGAVLDAKTNGWKRRLFSLESGAFLTLRSVTLQNGEVPHFCAIVLS
jgi:hypothetical protein